MSPPSSFSRGPSPAPPLPACPPPSPPPPPSRSPPPCSRPQQEAIARLGSSADQALPARGREGRESGGTRTGVQTGLFVDAHKRGRVAEAEPSDGSRRGRGTHA
ncbi:hypothetical protein B2J93_3854 [Marssonina coronariae]|uniref:Uncharacterized protein n=1 Tax=Diplocarpon coronariae TaxID=2795749 RepID=A0A218ZFU5_9HELO|nr:hypothetical protein B2J93_3854 [Marssonina coronariae]